MRSRSTRLATAWFAAMLPSLALVPARQQNFLALGERLTFLDFLLFVADGLICGTIGFFAGRAWERAGGSSDSQKL